MTTIRRCGVEGCTNPHRAKNLCVGHYDRWRRTGRPEGRVRSVIDPHKLVYLRRLVGLPAEGPTEEQRNHWNRQEAS